MRQLPRVSSSNRAWGALLQVVGKRGAGARSASVFPGANSPLHSETEGSQTLTYRVRATPKDVLAFYRDTLGRGGYQQQSADAETVVFQNQEEELSLSARVDAEGLCTVVLVSRLLPRGG